MSSNASSLFMKWPPRHKRLSKVESVEVEPPPEIVHARQRLEQTEEQLRKQLAEVHLVLARARSERSGKSAS